MGGVKKMMGPRISKAVAHQLHESSLKFLQKVAESVEKRLEPQAASCKPAKTRP